ncbi:MAG: hypothetical protein DLM58_02305 [Pseudonocardiales bacterium]|nr:MAG: hypothetical protein DLM58_02305 [Pseudonocardiales bacterium]
MAQHSRRSFLKHASVGAAAVGAAAVVPAVLAAPADAAPAGPAHAGPFVAWVKDAKAGQISVLVGEHEVVHTDRKLATRLAQIAAQAPKS